MASPVKEHGRLDPAFTWSSLERASDERLVALARGGVEVAIEAIVRRYNGALVRHACRFLDPESAELAVQEALVKGLIAIQDTPRKVQLRSLLFRIVHNEAVDTARRRSGADEAHDEDDEASSAEYLARVERLRGIVVGINQPDLARAQATERSREEVARDLAETRAGVEVLMQRARAGLRAASGSLLPRPQIRSWFENLSSPAMRGLVTAGAAALVVAVVAGAATLGTNGGGGSGPASSTPSASSSSDAKPRVAGPRREGGTRTTPAEPKAQRHSTTTGQGQESPPVVAPQQPTPTVSGAGGTAGSQAGQPKANAKPKKTKPQGNSGEPVTVLGEPKKGTTSSGNLGGSQTPTTGNGNGGVGP